MVFTFINILLIYVYVSKVYYICIHTDEDTERVRDRAENAIKNVKKKNVILLFLGSSRA